MKKNDDFVDRDLLLWILINQTETLMFKARSKELKRIGISPSNLGVLLVVNFLGKKATPSEVSWWLLREAPSISEILVRMEKEKLLNRVKDLKRKNMIRIVLTDKGIKALEKAKRMKALPKLISVLSEEEREQLIELLLKLRKSALRSMSMKYRDLPLPPA